MKILSRILIINKSLSERISDNEHVVKGLQENKEYEFRVAAVNKVGKGKWAQTDAPIEAREPDCNFLFCLKDWKIRLYSTNDLFLAP